VRLVIFDITGRRIRTLFDQVYSAGSIELVWDSRDNAGNEVASGVYVYRLQTAQSSFSKRLLLLR
jgi:flagellar hook assembly protein FlgD